MFWMAVRMAISLQREHWLLRLKVHLLYLQSWQSSPACQPHQLNPTRFNICYPENLLPQVKQRLARRPGFCCFSWIRGMNLEPTRNSFQDILNLTPATFEALHPPVAFASSRHFGSKQVCPGFRLGICSFVCI